MLGPRIITAIVLLFILGAVLAAPGQWPLPALLIVAAGCALWEWLRLVWPLSSAGKAGPILVALIGALLMASQLLGLLGVQEAISSLAASQLVMPSLVLVAGLFWLLIATTMVVRGNTSAASRSFPLAVMGVVAVCTTWWVLTRFYLIHGAWFLVSLMALVWVADIGAYAAGKTMGRHKLAPKVSPGKSIEGALGGIVAALLWVWASSYWQGSFGQVLISEWSWPASVLIVIALAAISIVGDLFESLLKRRAGVKDSSALLPGHGGVYDRIDALLPVSVLAWLLLQGLA
ncbi:phosphatidate cytidylyltransferase [Pusillimonas sp. CC-YST705]|uniref:Phosphatidate cytidylyltransferase n=1 Tax=Mesopusillimonas faecipullorum TaxID=2755040 RepID=A0ABS8CAQ6_9BURK|nr:phosphatidate cytidylyltransferase [Mesopusillimonas faecipullorum]MCB5363116.1 phosphatidate cytidylyltransferase [Mesopusillimonas faecipullorum]